MDSLLTLSIGDYRLVEIMLRLVVALVAMTALLLGFSTVCVAPRFRFPLILSSVSLLGAAWFESGVWLAWREGFELAGSSYCVTGQLLAGEDRIISWALAVPVLLFSFGLIQAAGSNTFRHPLARLGAVAVSLGIFSPISSLLSLVLLGVMIWLLCWKIPASATNVTLPLTRECRLASWSISLTFLITLLGGWHLLPLGRSAESILVRGELIRSLCEILSLVIPAFILLTGVLGLSSKPDAPAPKLVTAKERKPKPMDSAASESQSALFEN